MKMHFGGNEFYCDVTVVEYSAGNHDLYLKRVITWRLEPADLFFEFPILFVTTDSLFQHTRYNQRSAHYQIKNSKLLLKRPLVERLKMLMLFSINELLFNLSSSSSFISWMFVWPLKWQLWWQTKCYGHTVAVGGLTVWHLTSQRVSTYCSAVLWSSVSASHAHCLS